MLMNLSAPATMDPIVQRFWNLVRVAINLDAQRASRKRSQDTNDRSSPVVI